MRERSLRRVVRLLSRATPDARPGRGVRLLGAPSRAASSKRAPASCVRAARTASAAVCADDCAGVVCPPQARVHVRSRATAAWCTARASTCCEPNPCALPQVCDWRTGKCLAPTFPEAGLEPVSDYGAPAGRALRRGRRPLVHDGRARLGCRCSAASPPPSPSCSSSPGELGDARDTGVADPARPRGSGLSSPTRRTRSRRARSGRDGARPSGRRRAPSRRLARPSPSRPVTPPATSACTIASPRFWLRGDLGGATAPARRGGRPAPRTSGVRPRRGRDPSCEPSASGVSLSPLNAERSVTTTPRSSRAGARSPLATSRAARRLRELAEKRVGLVGIGAGRAPCLREGREACRARARRRVDRTASSTLSTCFSRPLTAVSASASPAPAARRAARRCTGGAPA